MVTFIDLENTGRGGAKGKKFARDVLIFVFSAIAETRGAGPEVSAAAKAYQGKDLSGVWEQAVARANGLNRYRWLLAPVSETLKNKREFHAIRPFLKFMTS